MDQQLVSMLTRLERFARTEDPGTILDPGADAEIMALAHARAEPGVVILLYGWLNWCRYLSIESDARLHPLALAVTSFRMPDGPNPDAPAEVARLFTTQNTDELKRLESGVNDEDDEAVIDAAGRLEARLAAEPDDLPLAAEILLEVSKHYVDHANAEAVRLRQLAASLIPDGHPGRARVITTLEG